MHRWSLFSATLQRGKILRLLQECRYFIRLWPWQKLFPEGVVYFGD